MLTIEQSGNYKISLLHLGFRPFFLLAGVYAAMGMGLWAWLLGSQTHMVAAHLPAISWHAHEMIYGYAMAVIAGFLLTAARNWTGVQTLNRWPLLVLALIWLAARLAPFLPVARPLVVMGVLDIAFDILFVVAFAYPIFRARQWKQISVWSKLLFLLAGNVLYYLGLAGVVEQGERIGLYSGLYVVVSLILLMGRRVIPFFIEKRTSAGARITNRKWVDIGSLVLMLLFLVVEVYWPLATVAGIVALLLFALHLVRMFDWHDAVIWKEPMLWVLYIGYGWLVFAFLLRGLSLVTEINPMLVVHAFTVGGLATITLGMMSRVSLGHTGREVYQPPAAMKWAFAMVILAALSRVILPALFPQYTTSLLTVSQVLWIAGFAVYVFLYAPFLVLPRTDGRYG